MAPKAFLLDALHGTTRREHHAPHTAIAHLAMEAEGDAEHPGRKGLHLQHWTLDRFMDRYKVGRDELHVSGVLRYLEHRDPDAIADVDVGPKARHCLLCSTRWQTFFVRPGMAEALYRLTLVEVREV